MPINNATMTTLFRTLPLIAAATVLGTAHAAPLQHITDTTPGRSVRDGVLNPTEYGNLTFFSSGTGDSFGGGAGSIFGTDSKLYLDSDTSGGINLGFQLGGLNISGGNPHGIVIYIDSVVGGFSDTTLIDDNNDFGRAAISGNGTDSGETELFFADGFQADYGIAVEENYAGLFQLATGGADSLNHIKSLQLTPFTGSQQKEGEFLLSDIGLNPGDSFNFVVSLSQVATGFRSNELHGHSGAVVGHIGAGPFTFDNFNTFSTVPEPEYLWPVSAALITFASLRHRMKKAPQPEEA